MFQLQLPLSVRRKQNKNNLVEIGNRKNGIQLKAVGSPDEKLDDFACTAAKVRASKVKRLDTAKIDTYEVPVFVKMPISCLGEVELRARLSTEVTNIK